MKIKLNSKKNKFIPVSIPHISKTDIRSVENVLKKGWISSDGPEVVAWNMISYLICTS